MYSITSLAERVHRQDQILADLRRRLAALEHAAAVRRAPTTTPRQPLLAALNGPGVG